MEGLGLSLGCSRTTPPSFPVPLSFLPPSPSYLRLLLPPRRRPPRLSSSRGPPPDLNQCDSTDLRSGRFIGEDPDVTLAKVTGQRTEGNSAEVDTPLDRDFKRRQLAGELRAPNRPRWIAGDGWGMTPRDGKAVEKVAGEEEELPRVSLGKPVKFPGDAAAEEKLSSMGGSSGKEEVGNSSVDVSLLRKPAMERSYEDGLVDGMSAEKVGSGLAGKTEFSVHRTEGSSAEVDPVRTPLDRDVKNRQPAWELRAPNRPRWIVGDGCGMTSRDAKAVEKVAGEEEEFPRVSLRKPVHLPGDAAAEEKLSSTVRSSGKEEVGNSSVDVSLPRKPAMERSSEDDHVDERSVEKVGSDLAGKTVVSAAGKLIEMQLKQRFGAGKNEGEAGIDDAEGSGDDSGDASSSVHATDVIEDDDAASNDWGLEVQNLPKISPEDTVTRTTPSSNSTAKRISESDKAEVLKDKTADDADDILMLSEQREYEESDWRRAEESLRTGEMEEVELVSCSSRGFAVSFGSLVGFLPYRDLGTKWKFLAFESWLRGKGLDPSLYREDLSVVRTYEVHTAELLSKEEKMLEYKEDEGGLNPDLKFEELLELYNRAKTKFLSSFLGQKMRAYVVLVDRNSGKMLFSGKPSEKENMIKRKKNLMAKLKVGDIVKCRVKKITFYGLFVEVEGVPALIHSSEISWDLALDPSLFIKTGQIVDAKVHQLDFALERFTLSLKEMAQDPSEEAFKTIRGKTAFGIMASTGAAEWADVDTLIREMEQIEGITGISKGRLFLSPASTPSFQVYMVSMYESKYKLLARNENKVLELIVQSSLDKEKMKAAIASCTNRVSRT